jgi:hypothetical protein
MKTSQKWFAAVLAMCVVFSFVYCDQVDDNPPEKEKAITTLQMSNPANPFDAEGVAHNDFLDFFIANADLSQSEWDRDDWFAILESYHASKGQIFTTEFQDYYDQFINVYKEADAIPCLNWPQDICLCLPWLCDWIITGLPLLPLTLPNPSSGVTEYERNLAFIDEVKFLEAQVLEDDSLSMATRDTYLKYYCVARYSAGYWHNVINVEQELNPWFEYLDLNSGRESVLNDILQADAAGALIGGLLGGPPGAIAGSAAASAGVALEHLLKLF